MDIHLRGAAVNIDKTEFLSTNVKSAEYDLTNSTLKIEFVKGGTYLYKDVPLFVYEDMVSSDSAGLYHAAMIKGRYDFERLE